MAKKRVIAYLMHEHEHDAALAEMPGATSTDSYVIGEADDQLNDSGGNKERVAFLFDRRAVTHNGLAAE